MTDNPTQRIEAFSDGVFAIAITLLILEIKVPHLYREEARGLGKALIDLWPSYFAYLLSFVMIGIYWANHHYIFKLFCKSDHIFCLLNVFFLMCISFLPFPTAILGAYVNVPEAIHTAVSFYALGMLLPAVGWLSIWLYATKKHILDQRLDPKFIQFLTLQFIASNLLFMFALAVSFWSAKFSLAICVGLTLLYLLPPKKPVYLS